MQFYYPYQLKNQINEHKIISMLTNSLASDIKLIMKPFSSDIIILVTSTNQNHNIYDDFILRICQNSIVVVINDNFNIINEIKYNQFIMNIINRLINTCMIKFNINLTISQIIFIGYKSSCKNILNPHIITSNNQIILIDPEIKLDTIPTNKNISVIVFKSSASTSLLNIYTLVDVNQSMIFTHPSHDINIINSRISHITNLSNLINKIIIH
jgi:hypothetical protein